MDGPNNPELHETESYLTKPLAGLFAYLAERGGGRALTVRQICLELVGQPQACPVAQSAEG